MITVKSIETKEMKIWIEQHNEFFILKYKERDQDVMALNAIQNLSLVLDMFETLVGKKSMSN